MAHSTAAPALRRCAPRAFDRALSLRLDGVISDLDGRPSWPHRLPLQVRKAWLERRIPALQIGGAR